MDQGFGSRDTWGAMPGSVYRFSLGVVQGNLDREHLANHYRWVLCTLVHMPSAALVL